MKNERKGKKRSGRRVKERAEHEGVRERSFVSRMSALKFE